MIAKKEVSAAERAAIFHEQYGNDLDAGTTLAELVRAAGDYISRIVGSEDTDPGMARIIDRVVTTSGNSVGEPGGWRGALEAARTTCFSEWRIGPLLHDLTAYAIYGIVLQGNEDHEARSRHLQALLTEAKELLEATPMAQWHLPANTDLTRLVRLATNRWALDNGNPVEPAALAELGGVSEGRIRNMMAGAKRTFSSDEGRIPAQEALAWLGKRDEFWNSVWREQHLPQYGVRRSAPLREPRFVPVARDGSAFHPGLQRGSGYTIGEKGEEAQIFDYNEALVLLQRMPTPYWRRPNSVGNWGIVAGVRWDRLDTSDLEVLAAHPDHRLPEDERA